MKKRNKVFVMLLAFLAGPLFALAGSSANAADAYALEVEEKYQFDDLEVVKRFNNWSIDGFSVVDQQSLIVRTSPSTAYLLVLSRKLHSLRFSHAIAISSTGSSVYAKFDTVTVKDRHFGGIPVRIARIYKLEGKEQREFVRQRIRNA